MNTLDVLTSAWPAERLGEAVEILARRSGLTGREVIAPTAPAGLGSASTIALRDWLDRVATGLDIEIEAVSTAYGETEQFLWRASPSLIRLPADSQKTCFLAVVKGGPRHVMVITPEGKFRRLQAGLIRDSLSAPLEVHLSETDEAILTTMGIEPARRIHARYALLAGHLRAVPSEGLFILRLSPNASIWKRIRYERITPAVLALLAGYSGVQAMFLASWALLGWSALSGQFEWAWLAAWALLLLTSVPFAMWWSYGETLVSTRAGILFKQRLLLGALKLEADQIRHMGSGNFMGHIGYLDFAGSIAFDDALQLVTAGIDVALGGFVLAAGIGGWFHVGLLALYCGVIAFAFRYYFRLRDAWYVAYRELTTSIVEGMLAQQTRLAQEERSRWHDRDDRIMTRYIRISEQRFWIESLAFSSASRIWLAISLAVIAPQIIGITERSLPALAIALGGSLLVYQGMDALGEALDIIATAYTALNRDRMLFESVSRPRLLPAVWMAEEKVPADKTTVLLARDLVFRYRAQGRAVLQGCSLRVERGERILLEGPSGSGKSTLAAVLAGLRQAERGMLLLWDFDQKSLGEDNWRRRVATTPQFHENHIFSETLAFNLLLSRRWPPTAEDLADAERICRELGLGALLNRMPAGLQQLVGERGWRLSHGERSRIYIARALLQRADLVILDESFGSLDPENLSQAMRCVIAHAPTLIVIAHP